MSSYRIVQASRIEGAEKYLGWIVEYKDSKLPYAVSLLFATSEEAAAEARMLRELDAKSENMMFERYR
jgi:hypothetical protein